MTLHISEPRFNKSSLCRWPGGRRRDSRKQAGEVIVHPRRRFELPSGGFFHYMAQPISPPASAEQYTFVAAKSVSGSV